MKVTAIPAQITTIEDRIVGNLNPTQLLLLSVPLFITAAIYFIFPPFGHYALYKILIAGLVICLSALLSLRIGDKIALDLLKLRAGYELRPRIYTYQKTKIPPEILVLNRASQSEAKSPKASPVLVKTTLDSRLRSQKMLRSSRCDVSFESKSGGLIVKVNVTS